MILELHSTVQCDSINEHWGSMLLSSLQSVGMMLACLLGCLFGCIVLGYHRNMFGDYEWSCVIKTEVLRKIKMKRHRKRIRTPLWMWNILLIIRSAKDKNEGKRKGIKLPWWMRNLLYIIGMILMWMCWSAHRIQNVLLCVSSIVKKVNALRHTNRWCHVWWS